MNNKDFSEILNNSKDLTIRQIVKLLGSLKYKTILLFAVIFLTITGSAFIGGQVSMKKEAAVMMNSPFSMRIIIEDNEYDFENLTLIQDPAFVSPDNKTILLTMREIQSVFDIIPIGQVVAKVDNESIPLVWQILFAKVNVVSEVKAQPREIVFNWNGHANDYNYKEKYIGESTVHRFYSDGCVLEYKVDKSRRSMPSSFRWINTTH